MASINPIDNILNDLRKNAKEYLENNPSQVEYIRGYEDAIAELEYEVDIAEPNAVFTVKLDTTGLKESIQEAVQDSTTVLYSAIEDFRGRKKKAKDAKEGVDVITSLTNLISDIFVEAQNVTTVEAAEVNGVGSFEKLFNDFFPHPAKSDTATDIDAEKEFWDEYDPRGKDEYDAYQASVDNGFWDGAPDYKHPLFLEFIGNKLLLLVGEIIEAHEEIRNGRGVDEIYYPTNAENVNLPIDSQGVRHKPEGFLVELADLSIRLDDLVGYFVKEWGTPHLYEIKEEKREYNRSRGYKHNKKF